MIWYTYSGSDGKESDCNAGDMGLIPGSGRFPWGGHGNSPCQYPCLENPHGQKSLVGYSPRGRDWATNTCSSQVREEVSGVWTQAPVLVPIQQTWVWVSSGSWWWTGRPGVLQSMGSQRVRHDWATGLNWTGPLLAFHLREWNGVSWRGMAPCFNKAFQQEAALSQTQQLETKTCLFRALE